MTSAFKKKFHVCFELNVQQNVYFGFFANLKINGMVPFCKLKRPAYVTVDYLLNSLLYMAKLRLLHFTGSAATVLR